MGLGVGGAIASHTRFMGKMLSLMAFGFLSQLQEGNCTPDGVENQSIRAKRLPTHPGTKWAVGELRSPQFPFFLRTVKLKTEPWSGWKGRYDHRIPVSALSR